MPEWFAPRRHADGAPDMDHYRRKAARLRRMARRRALRGAMRLVRRIAARLREPPRAEAGRGAWAARALLVAGALGLGFGAAAEPAPAPREGFTATPLHASVPVGGAELVHRVTLLELGPETATAPHRAAGDAIVLVVAGAVILEMPGNSQRRIEAGQLLPPGAPAPWRLRNASAAAPAWLAVSSVTPAGMPEMLPASLSE